MQDDILTVIRRVDENWAEGMLADKIGIFPISYVEVRALCILSLQCNSDRKPKIVSEQTNLLNYVT